MVIPSSLLSLWIVSRTSKRPFGSNIAVGSSSTIQSGFIASTPAMAIRCFWPPDNKCGPCSAYSVMFTAAKASSTRLRISALGTPKFSGPKATSSSTTAATIWLSGFWNTMPTCWRIFQICSSSNVSKPHTVTFPAVGCNNTLKCLANVLLPLPLVPIMATNSPRRMVRLTSSRARTSLPFSSTYKWLKWLTSIIVSFDFMNSLVSF